MGISNLPSIWAGSYASGAEWFAARDILQGSRALIEAIDDSKLISRKGFSLKGYCSHCREITDMSFNWGLTSIFQGELHLGFPEAFWCNTCGMNSRMRAVWEHVTQRSKLPQSPDVYMPEFITPFFKMWRERFPKVQGSEYISPSAQPGSIHHVKGHGDVRHEDLTKLSYDDESFDLIVSQEVFEHVPDYRTAFRECARTLRPGGEMVFSIPFFPDSPSTEVRATVNADGSINHILPPEYHGNPMTPEGSLCFQHFGWDILDDLRAAGFSEARATQYWAPWAGHLGWDFFVFSATR